MKWVGNRSRIQKRLLLTLCRLTLLLLLLLTLVALGCRLQLWESRAIALKASNHSIIIWAILLLCLFLFSFCRLAFVFEMWGYARIDMVNTGDIRLH